MEKKKQQKKYKRQRNTVREHQEQPSHLASANTLHCHCERELVHSSDSLKHCQGEREAEREMEKETGTEGGEVVRWGEVQQGERMDIGVTHHGGDVPLPQ